MTYDMSSGTLDSTERWYVAVWINVLYLLFDYCMFDFSVYYRYMYLQYFDTVGWVFWPVKTVSHITYTVLAGT